MGIRGLNSLIKKVCPECISTNDISKYSGKKFAIDASILLYKYRHVSNLNDSCINAHISGFLYRVRYYLNNNITPVFVFDGTPPEEKKETLKKRHSNRKKIHDKIELLQQLPKDTSENQDVINKEITRLSNQIIYVTKKHVDDCKELLTLLGITYHDAPDEAEKYCVFLYKEGLVDYVVSDDTDVFTFGGYKVLKCSIKDNIIEYDIKLFIDKINYTHDKFIDFSILSGCDYLPFIPNLAINTVYSLFKKHNSIDEIIALNKYVFPEEYNYKNIRVLFNTFNYEVPQIINNLPIDKINLKIFLNNINFKNLNKIINSF